MLVEKHYTSILEPYPSEKGMLAEEHNTYVFKISTRANKTDVKRAIEHIFDVKVAHVNVVNVKGKKKAFKNKTAKKKDWKKAYVKLLDGHEINLSNTNEKG